MKNCKKSWIKHPKRYPCGTRRLECQDWRWFLWELERHVWASLQHQIKWERPQAPGICQLHWSDSGIYFWLPQNIQKNHVTQSRWENPQSDWLHHGEETIQFKCEHRQYPQLSMSRHWKRSRACYDDLQATFKEDQETRTCKIRFDVDKLKDPHVAEVFQVMIGGKFAALSILDSDMDLDTLTDTFNAAVTDTANEILGKHRPVKKPWWDPRSVWQTKGLKKKKNKNDAERTTEYRTVN